MTPPSVTRLNLGWLIRLRWVLYAGEGALLLWAVNRMGLALACRPLWGLVGVAASSNVGLHLWLARGRPVSEWLLSVVMAADALLLTAVLALSGGPFNPFSTLYLVNVALGAVLLSARASWIQLAVSLLAFAALFPLQHFHPEGLALPNHGDMMRLHITGMWVAFALSGLLIVSFVLRVKRALAVRETELLQARGAHARRERMASLGALAAGAAHELATPLSTIAVVAKELEQSLSTLALTPETRQDLQLVREQVDRCRDILGQMSADLGHARGEPLQPLSLHRWATDALDSLPAPERARVHLVEAPRDAQVRGPPRALVDALRRLLQNAGQASPDGGPIELALGHEDADVWVAVSDRGAGMDAELLSRAGEPFFTTKAPGEGMGLGLFITRNLMEQLGGELSLHSRPGEGTTARLRLPRLAAQEDGA